MAHLRVHGVDDDKAEVAEQARDVQAANGVADLFCFRHARLRRFVLVNIIGMGVKYDELHFTQFHQTFFLGF